MWPDRVSNLGPLTYESGALLTALRGPAPMKMADSNRDGTGKYSVISEQSDKQLCCFFAYDMTERQATNNNIPAIMSRVDFQWLEH